MSEATSAFGAGGVGPDGFGSEAFGDRPRPREELLAPVRRVLEWMLAQRDAEGRIVCPEHGIVHSGKNAGVIVMACEFARDARGPERAHWLEVAAVQARHLVARLEREGDSTCFTFRPGRHDPYNCSNNVIDGGACADALAELVLHFGDELARADREAFAYASIKHAQTYLRYAIIDKGIPAQRAWAMTGAAGAWRLAGHDVLELAVMEGAGILAGIQHGDGSYPYHPLEGGAAHPGASDVSAFYQSRVTAFLMFALERMGRDPRSALQRAQVKRGLDFLAALFGPDGTKVGAVEAKPWYWGGPYEVAAHPFDVYALARGATLFGEERYARIALAAFRVWVAHLEADGRPTSHRPGPGRRRSYQCSLFWAGHSSWMARALPELERWIDAVDAPRAPSSELAIVHFPDASLTRLEDDEVVAWVRGARPGFNVAHGSPFGAGLLRVYSKTRGEELIERLRGARALEAEWEGRAGARSLARGWRSCGHEVRFSAWLARNALRRRHPLEAVGAPWHAAVDGVWAHASSRVASAFDPAPRTALLPDGVELESALAHRDGTRVDGSALVRRFRVDGGGLVVEDRLVAPGAARGLRYRLPERAREVERDPRRARYRLA